jgi:glycerol kinase
MHYEETIKSTRSLVGGTRSTGIWQKTQSTVRGALDRAYPFERVVALGVANQRETAVVWNMRTGRPYGNAIVWQCTRTRDLLPAPHQRWLEPLLRQRTGLVWRPTLPGPRSGGY